jgi:hypothetical protein
MRTARPIGVLAVVAPLVTTIASDVAADVASSPRPSPAPPAAHAAPTTAQTASIIEGWEGRNLLNMETSMARVRARVRGARGPTQRAPVVEQHRLRFTGRATTRDP